MNEALRALLAAARDTAPARITCDVFDTVLARRCLEPHHVFAAVARRAERSGVLPSSSVDRFPALRVEAERLVEASAGPCCARLGDIHRRLAALLGLSPAAAAGLAQTEFAVEQDLLRPVPEVVETLAACRATGARLAFVSDMYLSSDQLRSLLQDAGVWREGDEVVVSCEHGRRKEDGGLFAAVALAHRPGFLHLGDSAERDVAGAVKAGGLGFLYERARPARYERALAAAGEGAGANVASRLAGLSREVRLARPAGADDRAALLHDTAADLAGPLAVGYVAWVLQRARALGLRRLYFAAREGEILLRVARELDVVWRTGIELRYLYVSRNSLLLPSMEGFDDTVAAWLVPSRGLANAAILAARSGIAGDRIDELLDAASVSGWGDAAWTPSTRGLVRGRVDGSRFRTALAAGAAGRRVRLLDYLRQEGWMDGTPAGLVDTGWTGRSADCLARATGTRSGFVAFYFSLGERGWTEPVAREAFLHDVRTPEGRGSIAGRCVTLVELLWAAGHGSTLDYRREQARMVPVLSAEPTQLAVDWGVAVQQDAIARCAALVAGACTPDEVAAYPWRQALASLLEAFQASPSPAEAAVFGATPFSEEHGAGAARPFAAPFSWSEIATYARTGSFFLDRPGMGTWLEAALVLTPPARRRAIRIVSAIRDRVLP